MKKKLLAAFLMTAMGVSLVACSSNGSSAETAADSAQTAEESEGGSETDTESADAETQEDAEDSSDELSGTLTVYMPSPTDLNTAYVDGFEKATGIKVELFEGTTGEIQARLEAEKDNPVADVVVLASWSDGLAMKETGQIMSYPEAENADKLYDGWVDEDNMLFGTSASALGVIYNTTLIDSLDADWSELVDAKYKDMIAIPDPEKSGSCKDFLAGYMYSTDNDWSAWEGMAENGLMVAGANKAALETVTTGERAILVAGVDYNAYSNIDKGEPLAIYYPASGTVINPRPAMIMNTSKNVENAKAFIDYLMSDEAQQMVADAYLLPGRSDITCDNRTNVSDIPTFQDLDWNVMMENSSDIAARLNELCQ
ncbi:ABC transporter substrate-binding protein [Lachnoclostridium sp. An196]|uniref:ABC transporter substrate-binding protein n=1 Tax=Lachnoclostridium sp. An196 TaxID=1965583 RepID=UPI000B37891D|nr:ABC transporter substrate-binding protein [Lachnoclostridium sp. An196]OUP21535.1 ABC transporter substrate-binding protein [Lachnoclostridium sp. An196]